MPSDIGTIPVSWFHDNRHAFFEFIRMVWPSPTGTLYWTTYPANSVLRDVGFGEVAWDGKNVWIPGQFEQGKQTALAVSDITFGNADNSFSNMLNLYETGCKGVPIDVWIEAYEKDIDPITKDFVLVGRLLAFSGSLNRPEVGDDVRVSVQSYRNPLTSKFPRRRYTSAYGFNDIPPVNLKFQFGTQTVQLPTASRPTTPTATGGGGGGLPLPPSTGTGPTGRGPVVRGPRRGGPPTANGRPTRKISR